MKAALFRDINNMRVDKMHVWAVSSYCQQD